MVGAADVDQPNSKPVSDQSPIWGWLPTLVMNVVLPTLSFFALTNAAHLTRIHE